MKYPQSQLVEVSDTELAEKKCGNCKKWRKPALVKEGKRFVASNFCFPCLELGASFD